MSNIGHLLERYREHPAVVQLNEALARTSRPGGTGPVPRLHLTGLKGAQTAFVLAAAVGRMGTTALYIAESKEEAAYLLNDLQGILGEQLVFFFPDSFKRPAFFDDLNHTQVLQRSETVNRLSQRNPGPAVVVSYPEALFEKVVSPEVLAQNRIEVNKGETLDVDFVVQVLVEYGFERTDFVYEPGQFSLRGGIIDLFSYGNELPYRIELFDDEVESIRTFDPLTQLSSQQLNRLSIVPNLNTRFRQDQKVSLFRVLAADTVIWIKDFQFLLDRLQYC
ncbi:MAG: transcription-repair coupling factor, partial [Thermoanaerobaculia bacterium]|nr:transcription-repair coupling factor [Thermoanaerobaculia bacterium]